ncbi:MAG: PPC domain-containing protein [Chloroflexi bacterium]|nr:PPC domain-containing protein [Chloroflexota bacterium]
MQRLQGPKAIRWLIVGLLVTVCLVSPAQAVPGSSIARALPVYDTFTTAGVVGYLPHVSVVDMAYASVSVSDPAINADGTIRTYQSYTNSVWFRYTAPVNASLTLDTTGTTRGILLAVYTGSPGNLHQVAWARGWPQTPAIAQFPVVAGTTYSIMVVHNSEQPAGSPTFLLLNLRLDNDRFAEVASASYAPPVIFGPDVPAIKLQDISGARVETTDPPMPCIQSGSKNYANTVWYKYRTFGTIYEVAAETFGSGYDTVLAIYAPDAAGALQLVSCNDDTAGLQSHIAFTTEPDTDYYFMVAKYGSTPVSVPKQLKFTLRMDVPNDLADYDERIIPDIMRMPEAITQEIFGSTVSASDPSMSCATGGPRNFANTVWYRFVPVASRPMVVDTFGTGYDTVLGVYTSAGSGWTEVACNDDTAGTQSQVSFPASVGTAYYLVFAKYGSIPVTDSTNLKILMHVAVPNDLVGQAAVISAMPDSRSQDVYGSTVSEGEGSACVHDPSPNLIPESAGLANTVWYRFVPTESRSYVVDTLGSNYDTVLDVFSGSPGNLNAIGCNDNIIPTDARSSVRFDGLKDTTYYIRVAKVGQRVAAPVTMLLNIRVDVPNDSIYGAISAYFGNLSPSYTRTQDVYGTTITTADPAMTCLGGGGRDYANTVWYQHTGGFLPLGSRVVASTSGSSYDTVMGIYTGDPDNLTPVFCSHDAAGKTYSEISFVPRLGVKYYIMIARYGTTPVSAASTLRFNLRLALP